MTNKMTNKMTNTEIIIKRIIKREEANEDYSKAMLDAFELIELIKGDKGITEETCTKETWENEFGMTVKQGEKELFTARTWDYINGKLTKVNEKHYGEHQVEKKLTPLQGANKAMNSILNSRKYYKHYGKVK